MHHSLSTTHSGSWDVMWSFRTCWCVLDVLQALWWEVYRSLRCQFCLWNSEFSKILLDWNRPDVLFWYLYTIYFDLIFRNLKKWIALSAFSFYWPVNFLYLSVYLDMENYFGLMFIIIPTAAHRSSIKLYYNYCDVLLCSYSIFRKLTVCVSQSYDLLNG